MLDLLSGPQAEELLRLAVVGEGDGQAPLGQVESLVDSGQGATREPLTRWRSEVSSVHHRPGAGLSVVYRVQYAVGDRRVKEHLVASTVDLPPTAGVALVRRGEQVVRIWRRADDPFLPGLAQALDPAVVAYWLGQDQPEDGARSHLLSYRPTRRAVIRYVTAASACYLKVLPQAKVSRLSRRHEMLSQAGAAAPEVLGRPLPTVLMLAESPGRPLAEAIATAVTNPAELPDPLQIVSWLDRLPDDVLELTARPSWVDRIDFHAAAARSALADQSMRVDAVEQGVRDMLARRPRTGMVPTHGDFYEANIFTDAGTVSGVIDLDSLGPGVREDDLATLLGHMVVLRGLAPTTYPHTDELVRRWFWVLAGTCDPVALAARVAGVVLSLVAGTSREQGIRRLAAAEDWLRRASELAQTYATVNAGGR